MRKVGLFVFFLLGCSSKHQEPAPSASAAATIEPTSAPTEAPAVAATEVASAPPAASASAAPAYPGSSTGCPTDMVRVEGEYCPAPSEICDKHAKDWEKSHDFDKTVSERCLHYDKPSKCLSKKRDHLSFCMDRFEYPNVVGELPRVLTPWTEAKKLCEAKSKRLCTVDEFNFACEGPEMLPYTYGFDRDTDAKICNVDRPYRLPNHKKQMKTYDKCLLDPWCKGELERLDQREKIGERTTCVSWSGVFDLNGNVNEWVEIPKASYPNRSGLKGGWWGPVRSRCRPTVDFHKEDDYGYEQGFRCCEDAFRR
jgi:sulfatase modifying factor 1